MFPSDFTKLSKNDKKYLQNDMPVSYTHLDVYKRQRYLLHDVRAETALLILAPSLPFMAVSGAVRGCFLAARRVQPNITAQLIEQLVRMAVAAARCV